jgi:hypothetical protein
VGFCPLAISPTISNDELKCKVSMVLLVFVTIFSCGGSKVTKKINIKREKRDVKQKTENRKERIPFVIIISLRR